MLDVNGYLTLLGILLFLLMEDTRQILLVHFCKKDICVYACVHEFAFLERRQKSLLQINSMNSMVSSNMKPEQSLNLEIDWVCTLEVRRETKFLGHQPRA